MKIVNIIQRYPPAIGGSETWCQEISRYLARHGHRVEVLTMNVNKEEEFWREPHAADATLAMGRLTLDEGVVVRRFERSLPVFSLYHLILKRLLDWKLGLYAYGPHSIELYAKMQQRIRDADLVVLHTLPFPHNYLALVVARYFNKTVVMVPHFHPGHPDYERASHYWLLRRCALVLADTEWERQYLGRHGIALDSVSVAGVGIHPSQYVARALDRFKRDLASRHRIGEQHAILTFVGRKIPTKGVDTLIKAATQLLADTPLKVFLVGPGFDWFSEMYAGLPPEVREHVIDLGVLPHQDKVNLLHCTDLFVLPSGGEAFGMVFLEAWACGVPVVGTLEGAMPDLIGDDGFVSPYGDVDSLASTLRAALADKRALRQKGLTGKAKVLENYTWEAVGRQAEASLRRVHGRKRILLCANAYPPHFIGGAELVADGQAQALRRLGHDVAVFAGDPDYHRERHSMRRELHNGLDVYRVCLHRRDYSIEYVTFCQPGIERHFDAVLDALAPDVVHFHNLVGLSVGLISRAKRRGIRTVLTLHDHWGFCVMNTLVKRDGNLCTDHSRCHECVARIHDDYGANIPVAMRNAFVAMQLDCVDAFIAPSQYLADTYREAGYPADKINTIPYGIDIDRFEKIARVRRDGVTRFTFLGYFGRHKGLLTLLEAVNQLENGNFRINLVGEGELLPTLEAEIQKSRWPANVKCWGKVDNQRLEEVFSETDVVVLPSIWPENQPVSITEAMAARRPVVASRIGGIPELVEDGRTGYLFEPGNARQLADKMLEFMEHPSRVEEFGLRAFAKITGNTFTQRALAILEVYEREAPPAPSRSPVCLVACVGRCVNEECAHAMMSLSSQKGGMTYQFMMANWLTDGQIREARVLWVVDYHAPLELVTPLLRHSIPLLVPEQNDELVALCVTASCGLYYADRVDAVGCLRYLGEDGDVSAQLGRRAAEFLYAK